MSLKYYQNLWLKTVFSDFSSPSTGVSEVELQHLRQWSETRSLHLQQQEELLQYLRGLLPSSLCSMLGSDALLERLKDFIRGYKRIDPQHQNKLTQDLLLFMAHSAADSHFSEVCRYEAALRSLCFYQLPTALPAQKGPRLASWARVIYLGPFFPLVMATLKQAETIEDATFVKWSTRPQTPYLLLQEFKGPRLVSITPLVAECLELCHGDMEWEAIAGQVIEQHPELSLGEEIESLLRVEPHYLQEGILLRSASFFELR